MGEIPIITKDCTRWYKKPLGKMFIKVLLEITFRDELIPFGKGLISRQQSQEKAITEKREPKRFSMGISHYQNSSIRENELQYYKDICNLLILHAN